MNIGIAYHEKVETETSSVCQRQGKKLLTAKGMTSLQESGFCSLPCIISPQLLKLARAEALALVSDGALNPSENAVDVRQDTVCWLRETTAGIVAKPTDSPATSLSECVQMLRGLASELDESEHYTRTAHHCVPAQLQLALYSGQGAGFLPHRDNPSGPSASVWHLGLIDYLRSKAYKSRAVTAILYLNEPEWDVAATGGALRVYLGAAPDDELGDTAPDVRDISPCGGTLVVFDSRKVLHQVMPTFAPRLALTLWICDSVPPKIPN